MICDRVKDRTPCRHLDGGNRDDLVRFFGGYHPWFRIRRLLSRKHWLRLGSFSRTSERGFLGIRLYRQSSHRVKCRIDWQGCPYLCARLAQFTLTYLADCCRGRRDRIHSKHFMILQNVDDAPAYPNADERREYTSTQHVDEPTFFHFCVTSLPSITKMTCVSRMDFAKSLSGKCGKS